MKKMISILMMLFLVMGFPVLATEIVGVEDTEDNNFEAVYSSQDNAETSIDILTLDPNLTTEENIAQAAKASTDYGKVKFFVTRERQTSSNCEVWANYSRTTAMGFKHGYFTFYKTLYVSLITQLAPMTYYFPICTGRAQYLGKISVPVGLSKIYADVTSSIQFTRSGWQQSPIFAGGINVGY